MQDIMSIQPMAGGIKINRFPKNKCYMNLETGELVSFSQAMQQLETEYDFDDYTPMSEFWEYFDITEIPVDVLKQ